MSTPSGFDRRVRSTVVELIQPGAPETRAPGTTYVRLEGKESAPESFDTAASGPEIAAAIQQLQDRCHDVEGCKKALRDIGTRAAEMLELRDAADERLLHVDLVVNAGDLHAVPFESATVDGQPLFASDGRPIELTRRIRGEYPSLPGGWPAVPRILFAHATPPGHEEVPAEEHLEALTRALASWTPPEGGPAPPSVLTVLPQASLEDVRDACAAAREEERPYTHVHLLAHGCLSGDRTREPDGLVLDGRLEEPVLPHELVTALMPTLTETAVVCLSFCSSAGEAIGELGVSNFARELHAVGAPVVVASQFPLTIVGSSVLTETFYQHLLAGADVRVALHEARVALGRRSDTQSDWAALVGYVRLPRRYEAHLLDARLVSALAQMNVTADWARDLLSSDDGAPDASARRLAERLLARRAELEQWREHARRSRRAGLLEEALGLLGSSHKRLAEMEFRFPGSVGSEPCLELAAARDFYREAYHHNRSNHWVGTQYLALEAALNGRLPEHVWHVLVDTALLDTERGGGGWARGSLVELYLMAPLVLPDGALARARSRLIELCRRSDADATLTALRRQLRRYVQWWRRPLGFFPERDSDLTADAGHLLRELDGHEAS